MNIKNTKQPVCIVSVISDVYTDQRVWRTVSGLNELGYYTVIIGRQATHPKKYSFSDTVFYSVKHLNPLFSKGIGMYIFFNVLLFFHLFYLVFKHKKQKIVLYANDLDTLMPNYLIARLFGLPLVYDSHELFTEVPELQERKIKKRIWECVEKWIVPKLPGAITVSESIAKWYSEKYQVPFYVVRNISANVSPPHLKSRAELDLPESKKIIILQGTGINIQRGAKELVESMQYFNEDYLLLIIGGGDVIETLRKMVYSMHLENRVYIKNRMPANELYPYTANAQLGISIDKPTNLNYLYSLPNKLFSYINAHIPVLASPLPEVKKIIEQYEIGMCIENHSPEHIAEKIAEALNNPQYAVWKANTYRAAQDLNWEKEKEKFKSILQKHFNL